MDKGMYLNSLICFIPQYWQPREFENIIDYLSLRSRVRQLADREKQSRYATEIPTGSPRPVGLASR